MKQPTLRKESRPEAVWLSLTLAMGLLALGLLLAAGAVAMADSQGSPHQPDFARAARPAAPSGDGVWTPLGGPIGAGGQVCALAVHPTISGTVYAAVAPLGTYDSGPSIIYKTTNGAATWTPVFTAGHQVYSLGVTGTVVYAGAFNPDGAGVSIYTSHDSGVSWTPAFSSTDRGVWLDVAVHPTDTDVAIIGGWFYHFVGPDRVQSGLVYRTDDTGLTWTPILTTTPPDGEGGILAVMNHPAAPSVVWASARQWGGSAHSDTILYRSDDGGATWPYTHTLTNAHVQSLLGHPGDPLTVYAASGWGTWTEGPPLVFRTSDGGPTWTQVLSDAGGPLLFEPPNTVYTRWWQQIWASASNGDPGTWSPVTGIWDGGTAFEFDLGQASPTLYAGGEQRGVLKGTYDGANWNWEERNDQIEGPLSPRDLDVDPSNHTKMFAATDCNGGWLSTDGGWNWTMVDEACMGAFAINPDNPDIIYGGEYNCDRGPVVRSADGGLTFEPVFTPTFIISDCSGGDESILDIEIAPSMTGTVYAAGADHPNWSGDQAVVVRSLDDGASWTVVFTRPESSRIEVIAIDPTNAGVVYIGGEACDPIGCEGTIYRSTDGGDSWQPTLVTSHTIGSIAVDYQKPNVIYAATKGPYDVYKSTDGGDSWTLIRSNNPPFNQASGYLLAIDPHVPSHVYLGGWGYIAETPDGGQTWLDSDTNSGTPQMEPRSLIVNNDAPTQTLYAGFSGTWAYSRPAPEPGQPVTITMWTDPAGIVYANGLHELFYHALVVDRDENWVADGTTVTITYEQPWAPPFNRVKTTSDGHLQGGWAGGVTFPGVYTFTATANVTATAFVTVEFLYNPPGGIEVDAAVINATTAIVSATVSGQYDGLASDGTVVSFVSSLGTIDATALTARGVAVATLTTSGSGGIAVITATAGGFSDVTTVDFGLYRFYLPIVSRNG
ncbi:MAG: hypothetical protein JXA93_19220 [Anaerolineae bacterium]|nr:hypothetical protein [Anaerolineae bacterium]